MAQPHLQSNTKVSVLPLGPGLVDARTTALLKGRQLEIVRIVLQEGKSMKEHKAPGEITVQCLEGCIEFRTPTAVRMLEAGDFIHLEAAVPHSLHGIQNSSALVTMVVGLPG